MGKHDPAFPLTTDNTQFDRGLTKRELFAAMAMMAQLARGDWRDEDDVAENAVAFADVLIEYLEQVTMDNTQ